MILIKDLRSLKKEKTFVTILILIVFIASFASVITFGLLLLYNPDALGVVVSEDVRVAFVGNASLLEKVIGGVKYESIEDALSAFKSGVVDAVVWLPEENPHDVNIITVFLPKDEIVSIRIALVLKEKFVAYEKILRKINGVPEDLDVKVIDYRFVRVNVPEDYSAGFKFVYIVLIPLLVLTTAVISSGLLIDLISEEIETKTIHVLASTPLKLERFILEKLATPYIVFLCLTVTWMVLLFLNGIDIKNIPLVFLISASITTLFVSMSLFLTLYLAEREVTQLTFSLFSVGIVSLSFSHPMMPCGLLSRLALGSVYSPFEVIVYVFLSLCLLIISYLYASKRIFELV
jgi:ABC-type Na+ efflux pump permease subunit